MTHCTTLVAAGLFAATVSVTTLHNYSSAQSPSHLSAAAAPGAASARATSATSDAAAAAPPKSGAMVVHPSSLHAGTRLVIELSRSLNSKKLKPGDKIKAVLTQDLLLGGKIVAPVDSRLVGHITEAQPPTAEIPESRLGFVFDRIELKHHKVLEFQAVMQAAAPPAPRRSRVDEPDQMLPPNMIVGGSPSQNSGPIGRGSSGATRTSGVSQTSGAGLSDTTTVTNVHVGGTPGNSLGRMTMNSPKTISDSNKPVSAGAGLHGVYGIKNLGMTNGPTDGTPGPVLTSTHSSVKVEDGTQFLLIVTGAGVTVRQ
ncbi:MAG TPA: hypothetical protein VFI72_17385 [Candidatus Angelobacter sp.]|nr:hypothetical protein [Candidatus Angelobacter sp.]